MMHQINVDDDENFCGPASTTTFRPELWQTELLRVSQRLWFALEFTLEIWAY